MLVRMSCIYVRGAIEKRGVVSDEVSKLVLHFSLLGYYNVKVVQLV